MSDVSFEASPMSFEPPRPPRWLPFHAWPASWRRTVLAVMGLGTTAVLAGVQWAMGEGASSLLYPPRTEQASGQVSGQAPGVDPLDALRERLHRTEQRLLSLPVLREQAGALSTREVTSRSTAVEAGAAALPAWLERLATSSRVKLLMFEPIQGEAGNATSIVDTRSVENQTNAHAAFPRALEASPAFRLRVEGDYSRMVDLVERLARTEPVLWVDRARLTAHGATLLLELILRASSDRSFRLAPARVTPVPESGAMLDPFSRRRLPDTVQSARLHGIWRIGARRAAMLGAKGKTALVDVDGVFGDARVQAINEETVVLVPLTGGPTRTLMLREAGP